MVEHNLSVVVDAVATTSPCSRAARCWPRATTPRCRRTRRSIEAYMGPAMAERAATRADAGARRSSRCATCTPGTASRTSCTASTSTCAQGEVVTLLGRNGAGKTTTLKSIMGIVPRREGSIAFDGSETIAPAVEPHRAARHRATARRSAASSRASTSRRTCCCRRRSRAGGLTRRADLRAVSRTCGAAARARARSCRAASSRCSRSAASCAPARGCCCSTSRPRAWRR